MGHGADMITNTQFNTVAMHQMAKNRQVQQQQSQLKQHQGQGQGKRNSNLNNAPPLYKVFTSLHPYYMIGPYPIPTKNMWYCDNKGCQATGHGTFNFYQIRNWRSQQFGTNYVLCDTCVKMYQIDLTKQQPQRPSNSNIQNLQQFQNNNNNNNNSPNNQGYDVNMQIQNQFANSNSPRDSKHVGHSQSVMPDLIKNGSSQSNASNDSRSSFGHGGTHSVDFANQKRSSVKANSDTNVVKKGWMLKRGGIVKSWKRRYFVLRNDRQLFYYSNDHTSAVKGVAQLYEVKQIIKVDKQIFSVECRGRTWHFSCATEADRDDWCEKIRKLCKAPIMVAKNMNDDAKEDN